MASSAKKSAVDFKVQFRVNTVTDESLIKIIKKQGYTVVFFNTEYNDPDVSNLINALNVEGYINTCKGFTYADNKYRIVFINEDLSAEEKALVLAHEEGHIFMKHFSEVPIVGRDVIQEHEANEFAHYILYPTVVQKTSGKLRAHKRITLAVIAAIILCAAGIFTYCEVSKQRSYYGEYYITESGNKYHKEGCIFVKNKNNSRRMTKKEFESGEFTPCEMCLPTD